MNAKTLKALRGSIAKWQAIVDGTGVDEGNKNCPLCQRFVYFWFGYKKPIAKMCVGCPVYEKTGKKGCRNTPYDDYAYGSDSIKNAQAELDFLKSLLPEGK